MNQSKRVPLSERRTQDRRGIDAIITGTSEGTPGGTPEARPAVKLEKVTLYVRPDQVVSMEEIQLQQRRKTGKKPDKSDLIQEALDLLVAKYQAG